MKIKIPNIKQTISKYKKTEEEQNHWSKRKKS